MRLTAFPSGFYRLAVGGAVCPDSVEGRRVALLGLVDRLRVRGLTVVAACEAAGVGRATYYRWKARLGKFGVRGLRDLRAGGRRRRVAPVKSAVRELVFEERLARPGGKRQIHYRLVRRGVVVSLSSVGRVLGEFFERGVLQRLGYRRKNIRLSRAAVRAHAERKKSGVRASCAGELVQIDAMHERSLGRTRFHFTAVDPTTRLVHGGLYSRLSSRSAKEFLVEVLGVWPFRVRSIQVDNGSEFMGEFEEACRGLGIRLFTIPPRSPKLNGMVERMQRTYRDEHYAFEADGLSMEEQRQALQAYNHYYNHERIHSAIGEVPPMEYAAERNLLSQLT